MCKISFFLISIFFIFQTRAQEYVETGVAPKKPLGMLSFESFSYPNFLNGEEHSNFILGYSFDDKFKAELQGFYDTYLLADVIRFAVRGKYYTGNKFYFFTGVASEFERSRGSGQISTPRLYILNGTGYDLNEKINLELRQELQINKAGLGNYNLPNLLSVHGIYKF